MLWLSIKFGSLSNSCECQVQRKGNYTDNIKKAKGSSHKMKLNPQKVKVWIIQVRLSDLS